MGVETVEDEVHVSKGGFSIIHSPTSGVAVRVGMKKSNPAIDFLRSLKPTLSNKIIERILVKFGGNEEKAAHVRNMYSFKYITL